MLVPALRRLREARARRAFLNRSETRIHPSARVRYHGMAAGAAIRLEIGEGSIFEGRISCDRAGAEIRIGRHSSVGGSHLVCAERIEIGDDVLISWNCTILDHHSHALEWSQRAPDVRDWYAGRKDWTHVRIAPVRIDDKAWIGFNAIILPGVRIGTGAVVGAGSVVTRDVEPFTVVAGNPARPIRRLTERG